MKFQFKIQPYQTEAVASIVDCFAGQPLINPQRLTLASRPDEFDWDHAFSNADFNIDETRLFENIHEVQKRQNLLLSDKLISNEQCKINLDVEMETGTGKTYCYIKTIMELNKHYGWSKFIIMVPSIAIREGVYKSFQITTEHFQEYYGKSPQFFIYNSKQLHKLNDFASGNGVHVMIINIQAFNASGKDNRRIYEAQDSFGSRRPIDVIKVTRPILILDEPQKMSGDATKGALKEFNPLMILRYSATHRETHNKIYRLDALDAYNQKLVKKIAVRGISVHGGGGQQAFLYLESIDLAKNAPPVARMAIEIKQKNGIKRIVRRFNKGDNLFEISKGLEQYKGFVILQIDARQDRIEFTNGEILEVGVAHGDVTEEDIRRIQIRETIKAHLEKEAELFDRGIKVLSLFFIDKVVNYRDYSREDKKGDYARIFEEEYLRSRDDILQTLALDNVKWRDYLQSIEPQSTHDGYFSIDKKSNHSTDPKIDKKGETAGLSSDVDAYELILKDKERLLSFDERVRFIFSHSALREGWDNPNIFTMCMLKHSDNTISRRQEVGRGLRLCVNTAGERMDHPAIVHDINILTVVASESYRDFVDNLQREISDSLSARPRQANKEYFVGKIIQHNDGSTLEIDARLAKKIETWLIKNDYTDDRDEITELYHQARQEGTVAPFPEELIFFQSSIFKLIDSVFSSSQLTKPDNGRAVKTNPLNDNFDKEEFKQLWTRINRQAIYQVDFNPDKLVKKSIDALNRNLKVTPLYYSVQSGMQANHITDQQVSEGGGFNLHTSQRCEPIAMAASSVSYDLLSKIASHVDLTRQTIAKILGGIEQAVFAQFKQNPEQFIAEASCLINEQKASMIIENISYVAIEATHEISIFTAGNHALDFSRASAPLQRHIFDYAVLDSEKEHKFIKQLDVDDNVAVYAKLPKGFTIPTPVGDYTPDWAIAFVAGTVKHIYFVAETKGSTEELELRPTENIKIKCADKFFCTISQDQVKYSAVSSFDELIKKVIENNGTTSQPFIAD